MVHNYYYLITSLPYLRFGEKTSLSAEDFIYECGKWLAGRELKILRDIDINAIQIRSEDLSIIKKWKNFNRNLKEDLSRVRRAKKSISNEKVSSAYREIFEETTPLLMEKRMEKIRWDFIDECGSWYDFDVNLLALYFLKLQICERMAVFNKEEGKKTFDVLCEV